MKKKSTTVTYDKIQKLGLFNCACIFHSDGIIPHEMGQASSVSQVHRSNHQDHTVDQTRMNHKCDKCLNSEKIEDGKW